MKKIISVVGARPNFMKVAALHKSFLKFPNDFEHVICHTGQHFDEKMSEVFFTELELPKPKHYLGVSGGSHAQQVANIILKFEEVLKTELPDIVLVVGDVNSTLACALVASKLNIKVIHVESGLRSFDDLMPEEVNRKLTDVISDLLFVSEKSGLTNLIKEGVDQNKIHYVGNVMIDSLMHYLPRVADSRIFKSLNIQKKEYILITFHRPSNVDEENSLINLVESLNKIAALKNIIFPIHPRTRKQLENYKLLNGLSKNVLLLEPLGYIDFLALQKEAILVITDSGGIQEETTVLGVQCITVRDNTERPSTVSLGTNHLVGTDLNEVLQKTKEILSGKIKQGTIPQYWDGNAGDRIVECLLELN